MKLPLPSSTTRNVLITSALPYVNNEPHLGNIIGCVLSADCYARYCRLRKYNVLYVCGTDEYGTATELKALEEKVSEQALCDKYSAVHKAVYDDFAIEFDVWGRTSTKHQTDISQSIFKQLQKNGFINQHSMQQLYSTKLNRFFADRYVNGTCPKCGYADARGDQCDGCGSLMNANELINPTCKFDDQLVIKDSNHLFFDLSKLQTKCESFFDQTSKTWTASSIGITKTWFQGEGLKERCITRDLKWGTKVPLEGFEDKVFYVWFDAPIGYLSITAGAIPQWEQWWKKQPEFEVELHQFMGKDNVPFHSVIFPCTLMGTDDEWNLVKSLHTTEYLNYEGGKFSKSRGTGVFGSHVKTTGIPIDVWRYYLFAVRPDSGDTEFQWADLIARNNNELLANLGNFVNRLMKFTCHAAKYSGIVPDFKPNQGFIDEITKMTEEYVELMERCELRLGLMKLMQISTRGNQYLQEQGMNNTLFENERSACDAVIGHGVNLIHTLATLVQPFMPNTSEGILAQVNAPLKSLKDSKFNLELQKGHKLGKPGYLFSRIDPKKAEEYKIQFGGKALLEELAKKKEKKEREKLKKKLRSQEKLAEKLAKNDSDLKI